MSEPHGPPVITKIRDLMTWLLERIAGFPRTHRTVLGTRIGNLVLDVLEKLLEAAYSGEKKELLRRANLDFEKLRHLLRSSYELKCLSLRQYEFVAREIDEVGRMVGGWMKNRGDNGSCRRSLVRGTVRLSSRNCVQNAFTKT